MENLTGAELQTNIEIIRSDLLHSRLTYEEARIKAQPYIDEMNRRGKVIAKKYNKRFSNFKFAALMR